MNVQRWKLPPAVLAAVAIIALAALAGCGPSKPDPLAKALAARVDPQPTYTESARFLQGRLDPNKPDYVMWSMDYSSLCLLGGNLDAAKAEMHRCFSHIEKVNDEQREKAAAMGRESAKIFKGEPFERAMLCTYLGLLHYMDGDYNNARIFFTQADMQDATTGDDRADYRHDFRLAWYWLGRSYAKLGQPDNARLAFSKAAQRLARKGEDKELSRLHKDQAKARTKRIKLETKCYQKATTAEKPEDRVPGAIDMSASPSLAEMAAAPAAGGPVLASADSLDAFLSPAFQGEANLILWIETGPGPIKFLTGQSGEMDQIVRAGYAERRVTVELNGQPAGVAFQMLDLFHQADTRGTSDKDKVQATKGVSKAILKQLPYISYAAGAWDVRADDRYWRLLPGEVHVYAAKVRPGLYTLRLECFDSNDCLLPRYRLTRYCVPVLSGRENIYLLNTVPEADNVYQPPRKK